MEKGSKIYVGMDVHQKEIVVSILEGWFQESKDLRFRNDEKSVHRFARRLRREYGDRVSCVYEAGSCGYVVKRLMEKEGVCVEVIAPSLIPRKPGERVKSDQRDARNLAEHHRAGSLTVVREPSEDEESARDLCRCRSAAKADQTRARHRLSKWLLRRGLVFREAGNWTVKHLAWLRRLKFESDIERQVFEDYLGEVERLDERLLRLESQIETLAQQDSWREKVGRLRCFRGLDTTSAMVIATEIFDFRRFADARHFMGFNGLVPGLDQSGDRRRGLPLTKTGNSHVRRVLIQAGWNNRARPTVSGRLRKRREGQDERVIAIADKAQSRLYRRYQYLVHGRGMLTTKATAALARELAGFIWSAMTLPETTNET